MAFTFAERDLLRTYMGYAFLFSSSNKIFESEMDAIDGIADGGATIAAIRAVLAKLASIESQIDANSKLMLATEVTNEVKFDAVRNDRGLRSVGRSLIRQLSIRFSCNPAEDYFARPDITQGGDVRLHRLASAG